MAWISKSRTAIYSVGMEYCDIAHRRLYNQGLSATNLMNPSGVVGYMGAVQAQDYAGAKWALGQRISRAADSTVEQAFNQGKILRTHVLRPTWHFVTPADIRWMLKLSAPRIRAGHAHTERRLGLDQATFKKSNTILTKALQGGNQLTRPELASIFQKAGISADGLRLIHLMMRAELDGVICSGPRRGRQFTYALLDERAPPANTLERDEALAQLAKRYFISHGPATLRDFVWWSGMTMTDARNGIEMLRSELGHEVLNGQTYWFSDSKLVKNSSPSAYLLPNYDEYMVGYTARTAIFDVGHADKLDSRASVIAQHTILIDGQVVGTWKRTIKRNEVVIELTPFIVLTEAEKQAVARAAEKYGEFLELPVALA